MTRMTSPESRDPDRAPWSYAAGVCLAANAVVDLRVVPAGPLPYVDRILALMAEHDAGVRLTSPGRGEGALGYAPGTGGDGATVTIPAGKDDRDWIDGYSAVLEGLAAGIDLSAGPRRPGTVAIVGLVHDRNEGDALGNAAELDRICRRLGLERVSTWLAGGGVADLARAAEAEVIVALPCGAEAAATLAARTGARCVEAPLPFGLAATREFVRILAEATGREASAAAFVEEELSWAARALEWIVPRRFLGRPVAFSGSPLLAEGFADIATLVGLDVVQRIATGRERPLPGSADRTVGMPAVAWTGTLSGLAPCPGVDLVVGPALAVRGIERFRAVEFGFPSRDTHFCGPAPFLGFEGFLFFVDRLSNAIGDRIRAV